MADNIETKAQEFISALNTLEQGSAADVDTLVALFAQDASLTNSALHRKGTDIQGKEAVKRFWTEYKETLGDVKSEFHEVTINQSAAGLFWTTTGKDPAGGDINYDGSTLLRFNDQGLITFFQGYYDTRELEVKAPLKKRLVKSVYRFQK